MRFKGLSTFIWTAAALEAPGRCKRTVSTVYRVKGGGVNVKEVRKGPWVCPPGVNPPDESASLTRTGPVLRNVRTISGRTLTPIEVEGYMKTITDSSDVSSVPQTSPVGGSLVTPQTSLVSPGTGLMKTQSLQPSVQNPQEGGSNPTTQGSPTQGSPAQASPTQGSPTQVTQPVSSAIAPHVQETTTVKKPDDESDEDPMSSLGDDEDIDEDEDDDED
eukprot:Blabericola_migrator_1__6680@NODE_3377_length_1823_cov_19_055239_g2105_i0_p1_GENE_NODE_3377_length_1823_cov_19_055239_g2105_i0NODE_3377_length_1823_cov_19_055239_g2105_i0_p1_ORF_typecomplete_len218_score55_77_NODE_3377_length_1823_cov_19_055239_g2105_i09481601